RSLDSTAVHDFAAHEYLLPPDRGFSQQAAGLSPQGQAYVQQLTQAGAPPDVVATTVGILTDLESAVKRAIYDTALPGQIGQWIAAVFDDLYQNFPEILLQIIAYRLDTGMSSDVFKYLVYVAMRKPVLGMLQDMDDPRQQGTPGVQFYAYTFLEDIRNAGQKLADKPAAQTGPYEYPFATFPASSVNVG